MLAMNYEDFYNMTQTLAGRAHWEAVCSAALVPQ
jgi:hypothetical protein